MSKKIAVGMSGGVDSSVAAALLLEQGYDVTGVFIEAYNEPGCRTDDDKKDALQAALRLGIPFQSLDMREEYREKVVTYFFETYKRGATPNPDVVCNREVKFGLFYDWASAHGFGAVATGHYARITEDHLLSRSLLLQRAEDTTKDQSYFLWHVRPDHFPHILFPLGAMRKKDVRAKAHDLSLPNADKPDSMGVCMMGEFNVRSFLLQHLGEHPGDVVYDNAIVGKHRGLWFHTVGQRGGFDLDKQLLKNLGHTPEVMKPLYVVGKDVSTNTLVVGSREQATRDVFRLENSEFLIPNSALHDALTLGKLSVRIRNLGELMPIRSLTIHGTQCEIVVAVPIFGVAEGQAGVLYMRHHHQGDEIVVGGGEISV